MFPASTNFLFVMFILKKRLKFSLCLLIIKNNSERLTTGERRRPASECLRKGRSQSLTRGRTVGHYHGHQFNASKFCFTTCSEATFFRRSSDRPKKGNAWPKARKKKQIFKALVLCRKRVDEPGRPDCIQCSEMTFPKVTGNFWGKT